MVLRENHQSLVENLRTTTTADARADIYAIGAVGYFLLTGTPVFTGATVMEICMKHVREAPELPSVRKGQPVSAAEVADQKRFDRHVVAPAGAVTASSLAARRVMWSAI